MEKRISFYDIEDLIERMDDENLTFDYPIQRADGQWDKSQKALLIDSVLKGYIIPHVYIVKDGTEDFSPMSVLDGKQRLTTLYDFAKDKFALPKDMDDIVIIKYTYDTDKNAIKDEKIYKVAGKKFSDLDPALKRIFNKFKIDVVLLAGFTDEEIEEQFYRLNNGCTFTKAQKANVKLGTEMAERIEEIEQCDFFENRACFTNLQRKRGEVKSCILQTMMLLSNFEYKNFGMNEVMRFSEELSNNPNLELIERTKELYDKLFCVLPDYDKELDKNLKKINIPIIVKNMDTIEKMEASISDKDYEEFLLDWFIDGMICSGYTKYCGQGSTSKEKVRGRISLMREALETFIEGKEEGGCENGIDKNNV